MFCLSPGFLCFGEDGAGSATVMQKIISGSITSDTAVLDITGLTTDFRAYVLVIDKLLPVDDGALLVTLVSDDGGSSFDIGASDYAYSGNVSAVAGITNVSVDASTAIVVTGGQGNVAGSETSALTLFLWSPNDSSQRTKINATSYALDGAIHALTTIGGIRRAAQADDAIRLVFTSGDIASLNYTLYGLVV